jgi:hypothetical protein
MAILTSALTNLLVTTNLVSFATNITVSTNGRVNFQAFIQNQITYGTNHAFVATPVTCPTNAPSWRQGIERITFVRLPDNALDELTYSLYNPITNDFSVTAFDPTNKVYFTQRNRRTLTTPDFLITAADLVDVPGNATIGLGTVARDMFWNTSTNFGVAYQNQAGPGTIEPGSGFIFDKSGPVFLNPLVGDESTQSPLFIWGSFDGTTNAPVVYPNGTSIANLENQLAIQIRPSVLPVGTAFVPYPTTTLTATGGTAPYTFVLAPGSGGLPPGISMSSSGVISGTPTQTGIFDFIIRLTDSASVTVDFEYAITVNP